MGIYISVIYVCFSNYFRVMCDYIRLNLDQEAGSDGDVSMMH